MTIVVGYIPTEEGSAAVDSAIAEAQRAAALLIVVNTGHYGDFSHPTSATEQDVDALDAQLTAAGVEHEIRRPTDGGSAADAILEAAAQTSADLIVIGIRRRSAIGKLLTGSTAQQILLDANCAVLAVKPRRRASP